jgi:acetylornithine deacetylase/succinyl-diaminopimelate desuccinylase-like protein
VPGLLEIRFYAAQGMPAFAYGPGLLSVAHGPNEYVDLPRIADTAARFLVDYIPCTSMGSDLIYI